MKSYRKTIVMIIPLCEIFIISTTASAQEVLDCSIFDNEDHYISAAENLHGDSIF